MKIAEADPVLKRWEFLAAIAFSAALVVLHTRLLLHAGPLWRDEVSSYYVASTPSLSAFRTALVLDPFPALFVSLLRIWITLGFGATDFGLRVFGWLIGVCLLGGIWICARLMDKKGPAPLWPLALFALAPITLAEGDSLRAYGIGLIGIVLSFGFVWRIAFDEPRMSMIVAATGASLVAGQSLYLNSLVLFAICVAGMLVGLRRKQVRRAFAILCVGVIAAVSLLPYAAFVREARQQVAIEREFDAASTHGRAFSFYHASAPAGWLIVLIMLLLGAVIVISTRSWRRSILLRVNALDDRLLFAFVVLALGAVPTFGLLWSSHVHSARYHLPLIAVASLSLHAVHVVVRPRTSLTTLNLLAAGIVAVVCTIDSYQASGLRNTNCDVAAAAVAEASGSDDFVVVNRFTHAPTFQRYYRGSAPWTSVPPAGEHLQHPAYLARPEMMNRDAISGVLQRIESELKAGHKVFLVGRFASAETDEHAAAGRPKQIERVSKVGEYLELWRHELFDLLRQHAVEIQKIPLADRGPVNRQEKEDVFVFVGWKA